MSSVNADGSPAYINAVFASVRLRLPPVWERLRAAGTLLRTAAPGQGRASCPGLRRRSPRASAQWLLSLLPGDGPRDRHPRSPAYAGSAAACAGRSLLRAGPGREELRTQRGAKLSCSEQGWSGLSSPPQRGDREPFPLWGGLSGTVGLPPHMHRHLFCRHTPRRRESSSPSCLSPPRWWISGLWSGITLAHR